MCKKFNYYTGSSGNAHEMHGDIKKDNTVHVDYNCTVQSSQLWLQHLLLPVLLSSPSIFMGATLMPPPELVEEEFDSPMTST